MGNKIINAPNGENTSPTGTEGLPLTGSKYITLNTIKGFVMPAYSSDSTTYLNGTGEWTVPAGGGGTVYDSDIVFTDITVGNADSDHHGFLAKLSSDSTLFMNGKGEWDTPTSGGGWTQIISEDGTTFSNFTADSGTWASNGTVIKQTDTGANESRAKYTSIVDGSVFIMEAEVQIQSGGTARRAGLIFGYNGGNLGGGGTALLAEAADAVIVDNDTNSNRLTVSFTVAQATWYKIRAVVSGDLVSVYVDGTLKGTAYGAVSNANASYCGLFTYQGEGWFRNIKAWMLTKPA